MTTIENKDDLADDIHTQSEPRPEDETLEVSGIHDWEYSGPEPDFETASNGIQLFTYPTGTGIVVSNYPIDEFITHEQALALNPTYAAMQQNEGETDETFARRAAALTSLRTIPIIVRKDRWQLINDEETVKGEMLDYRISQMIFEEGATLTVHATKWFRLQVDDLYLVSPFKPNKIIFPTSPTPPKKRSGANGVHGADAHNEESRGKQGGNGGHGQWMGENARPATTFYFKVWRCDHGYPLEIIANGGNGGNGGKGHKGRDGVVVGLDCKKGCKNGSSGGHGGNGGNPTSGGHASNGSIIRIEGPQTFLDQSRNFIIRNAGGKGGRAGLAGWRGRGGAGGRAGSNHFPCIQPCADGRDGWDGKHGSIEGIYNGWDGDRGTISHILA